MKFVAGVLVVVFAVFMNVLGFMFGQDSVAGRCLDFGEFKVDGRFYDCTPRAEIGK